MQPSRLSTETLLSSLKGIKNSAERLMEEIKLSEKTNVETERISQLLESYKENRLWISTHIQDIGQFLRDVKDDDLYVKLSVYPYRWLRPYMSKEEALNILYGILQGCETAMPSLQSMLKPEIPLATLNKLTSLRAELEGLELDPDVMRNLEEAISEAEQAHHLACALSAGRVVQYLIDKALGSNVEEKAKHIIELMARKGTAFADKKTEEAELNQMLRIEKLSRNMVSHNIHYWPGAEDAIMLLVGAIKLSKLMGSEHKTSS